MRWGQHDWGVLCSEGTLGFHLFQYDIQKCSHIEEDWNVEVSFYGGVVMEVLTGATRAGFGAHFHG